MKKIKEASEVDILRLVEASFEEKGVLGDTHEEKIAVFYRFKDLAVKFFDILLEKFVSARIELARFDGAHQSGHKILHAARQGVIRFALVRAHAYHRCRECGNNMANRICDVVPYVNGERTIG